MIYPLFVAFLSIIFALQVASDYTVRKRTYKALWATALVMTAVASMGYLGALQTQSVGAFRLYYVFGALLVAPYMGMGSLFLVVPEKVANKVLWGLHVFGVVGAVLILRAPVNVEGLASLAGTSGQGILQTGPWLPVMILLNIFGTVAVAGVALYSAVRSLIKRQQGRFTLGNVIIAIGFFFIAMAGAAARWWPDWDGGFWLMMAMGWLVAFGGFRVISTAAERQRGESSASLAPGEMKS